jgi:hypothetical protein
VTAAPTPARRPRLTGHQAQVHARLARVSAGERWISGQVLGSRGALGKLVEKGYAVVEIRTGPRGGERRYYRSVGP